MGKQAARHLLRQCCWLMAWARITLGRLDHRTDRIACSRGNLFYYHQKAVGYLARAGGADPLAHRPGLDPAGWKPDRGISFGFALFVYCVVSQIDRDAKAPSFQHCAWAGIWY